ncbi:hypothetical protein BaRGS_00007916 [Batillaria attramentaria]|uniref:Uncharacterized protein n=1 Tax=Batillaria attramentaria TaxID=370345 RepID=A0ABD0LP60_9CAEN
MTKKEVQNVFVKDLRQSQEAYIVSADSARPKCLKSFAVWNAGDLATRLRIRAMSDVEVYVENSPGMCCVGNKMLAGRENDAVLPARCLGK